MSTFKAALRVVDAHPLYLTIYALVISLMGAVIVLTSSALLFGDCGIRALCGRSRHRRPRRLSALAGVRPAHG